jgi:membrane protein
VNDKFIIKELPKLLADSVTQFIDDKGLKMSAALSYYTAFSIGPMLLIVISFVGLFFGEDNARIEIVGQANKLMVPTCSTLLLKEPLILLREYLQQFLV